MQMILYISTALIDKFTLRMVESSEEMAFLVISPLFYGMVVILVYLVKDSYLLFKTG